jgi:hypothetical protein
MSWLNDLGTNLKKIILMQDRIDRLGDEVKELRTDILDHGNRLIRIETMIEMAQAKTGSSTRQIER